MSNMSNMYGNDLDDELAQLLDEAVAKLTTRRTTFTDEEALQAIWERGYDFSPQNDPLHRFALAAEGSVKHHRQWRLSAQPLANNRLLDALLSGAWDGRDLDAALARLDAEDHTRYVFCPSDPRFATSPDGALEAAEREYNPMLPAATQAALDALGPTLLANWHSDGDAPLTVQQVTERLGKLGWLEADQRGGWLLVRAWLLGWTEVVRVGQDYWLPVTAIPAEPGRKRLQVLPVTTFSPALGEQETEIAASPTPASPAQDLSPTFDSSPLPQSKEDMANHVGWTFPLRTIHLLEGFLPVPARARSAYPPRAASEGERAVLRGLWFDSDEALWLWLDRQQDRLYGPDLAEKLAWLEAGALLRIQWTPNVIALRLAGHDDEVQREEERLVDPQALKALRGGLGENYRQSLQAILSAHADGLTFPQLVQALRQRQGHDVARNSVRAILSTGGFLHRHPRWFAAPHNAQAARQLRAALMQTLVDDEEPEQAPSTTMQPEPQRKQVWAIRARLAELVQALREGEKIG